MSSLLSPAPLSHLPSHTEQLVTSVLGQNGSTQADVSL